uniref:Uncharacterized protein n=1 Tax=Triticum urartu TaxID=4572 RepID=A0A8R7UBH9_TRIUA
MFTKVTTSLRLRFLLPLMASLFPKSSMSRIFFLMLLLLMSTLLRLLWSSTSTFL